MHNHFLNYLLIAGVFIGIRNPLLFGQGLEKQKLLDVNFEFQAYPTGLIPGIQLEKGFAHHHAVQLRFGYNWVRHRGLGVHEDERGNGFGFTVGYKRYFKRNFYRWFAGIRNDFWFNSLNWRDNIGEANEISGTTDITVLQPTIEGGYLFEMNANENSITFAPTLALGFEINVREDGAPVGDGLIVLLGFQVGYRFNAARIGNIR